ncbi:MAG: hypothetical protein ACJ742_00860 [Actinomycetes bacterium]
MAGVAVDPGTGVTSIGDGTAPASRSSAARAARTRAGVSAGASPRSTTATRSPAGSWTTWYWRTSSSSENGARSRNGWTATGPQPARQGDRVVSS